MASKSYESKRPAPVNTNVSSFRPISMFPNTLSNAGNKLAQKVKTETGPDKGGPISSQVIKNISMPTHPQEQADVGASTLSKVSGQPSSTDLTREMLRKMARSSDASSSSKTPKPSTSHLQEFLKQKSAAQEKSGGADKFTPKTSLASGDAPVDASVASTGTMRNESSQGQGLLAALDLRERVGVDECRPNSAPSSSDALVDTSPLPPSTAAMSLQQKKVACAFGQVVDIGGCRPDTAPSLTAQGGPTLLTSMSQRRSVKMPSSPTLGPSRSTSKRFSAPGLFSSLEDSIRSPPSALRNCLSSMCFKSNRQSSGNVPASRPRHRVTFDEGQELFEGFTPYSKVYGMHPDAFFFDRAGKMVLRPPSPPSPTLVNILDVKVNDKVECVVEMGVDYRTRPQLTMRFANLCTINYGEKVVVKKVCGEWIQDSIGWLPLLISGQALFQIM